MTYQLRTAQISYALEVTRYTIIRCATLGTVMVHVFPQSLFSGERRRRDDYPCPGRIVMAGRAIQAGSVRNRRRNMLDQGFCLRADSPFCGIISAMARTAFCARRIRRRTVDSGAGIGRKQHARIGSCVAIITLPNTIGRYRRTWRA